MNSSSTGKQASWLRMLWMVALVPAFSAHAQFPIQYHFDEDFDDRNKSWQEIEVQIPPIPKFSDLVPLHVGPTATQRFSIDPKSLSVGSDAVVRYTMVATSPTGATNISYEGIRCASYEHKLYAFGHPDGKWARSRRDQWERISRIGANAYQAALAEDFVCESKLVAGTAVDILQRIRMNQVINPR